MHFLSLILSCYMLGGPSICLFLAEQCTIYLPKQFFWRPRLLLFQRQGGPWIKMEPQVPFGITQSTLSAEARDVFLWNQGFFIKTKLHKWILQSAFATFMTWKPAPGRQEDWPFSLLLNSLLDNFLISHDMSWKWITFTVLSLFMLKLHVPN